MGVCQPKEKGATNHATKDSVLQTMKFERTSIEFIHGNPFKVSCDGILIPVIQIGDDIKLDTDSVTELKNTDYQ